MSAAAVHDLDFREPHLTSACHCTFSRGFKAGWSHEVTSQQPRRGTVMFSIEALNTLKAFADRRRKRYAQHMRVFLVFAVLLTASLAAALVPPHVTQITPSAEGARLHGGGILKFHGYSFTPGLESSVTNAAGDDVPVEHYLWTEARCADGTTTCDRNAPGAVQMYGVLSVKLPVPQPDMRLEIHLMEAEATVTTDAGGYRIESAQ